MKCALCPRMCKVDRSKGELGFCKETHVIRIARASLHMWEEPCISGQSGSGTVFFSGCHLGCVYCQNRTISSGKFGVPVSVHELSDIFLELQNRNAENINLVTPTHFVPGIAEALTQAKLHGLSIPVVYNTGSYENVETLKMLDGLIDIYLPDLKYVSTEISSKYSNAPDYFEKAAKAIKEMYRQVGPTVFSGTPETYTEDNESIPLMKRGIIVRHLVLPGHTEDSKRVIEYLYKTYGDTIFISIMNQFTPLENVESYPELNRKITEAEYNNVLSYAMDLGLENAFIQEGETAKESFIPDFSNFDIHTFLRR